MRDIFDKFAVDQKEFDLDSNENEHLVNKKKDLKVS